MIRYEIMPGVFLTEIAGQYKKSRLSVYTASPLARKTLTATAMLPFLFERGTAGLPDMTLLKRRQNALYGANLSAGYFCAGFARVLDGHMDGVDGALIPDGDSIAAERTRLLLDMLFDPCLVNGGFPVDWVEIEREKLRETIRSAINDKRDFCLKLLTEAFFMDDERALPPDGFEEDLDALSGMELGAVYRAFMESTQIEVIYVGSAFPGLADVLRERFSNINRHPAVIRPLTPVPKQEELRVVREMEIEQDKLALAFTTGRLLSLTELAALRIANGIFGASPTSRLFVNVREAKSLCYSVGSQPSYRAGGGLLVECGIAHEHVEQAREAVLCELDRLIAEGPTETEMQEIKLLYRNMLQSITNTSGGLANYHYTNLTRYGKPVSPEEELAMLEAVTADEVVAVLGGMHLNTSCLLEARET